MQPDKDLTMAAIANLAKRDTAWVDAFSKRLHDLFKGGWIDGADYDFIASCVILAEPMVAEFMKYKKGGA